MITTNTILSYTLNFLETLFLKPVPSQSNCLKFQLHLTLGAGAQW